MKSFYKRLLILGVAIGIFICTLIVGVAQIRFMVNDVLVEKKNAEYTYYSVFISPKEEDIVSMRNSDVESIMSKFPEDVKSTFDATQYPKESVKYGEEVLNALIAITDEKYLDVSTLKLVKGRYFDKKEYDGENKVCLIHENMYNLLGMNDNIILNIDGEEFKVIGVLSGTNEGVSDPRKRLSGIGEEQLIYMPALTYYKYIEKVSPERRALIFDVMIKAPQKYSREFMDKVVSDYASRSNGLTAYLKISQVGEENTIELLNTLRTMIIILIIASLILVVAGMNIIQISTANIFDIKKEIGLRMALGAKKRDIIKEVFFDIALCTLKGGYIGVAGYAVLCSIINIKMRGFTDFKGALFPILKQYTEYYRLTFNIKTAFIGMGLAVLIGILSSIIPAVRAASIDPITALRKE